MGLNSNIREFKLPNAITKLVEARDHLRCQYKSSALNFTLDGKLVGDIGEAIAVDIFGLKLRTDGCEGFDGIAIDGKTTVQVKSTGTGRGPVFRHTTECADHLLFLIWTLKRFPELLFLMAPRSSYENYFPTFGKGKDLFHGNKLKLWINPSVMSRG